jgi:hypothetical protein
VPGIFGGRGSARSRSVGLTLSRLVPIEQRCTVRGAFSFGLPWPWEAVEPQGEVLAEGGDPIEIMPLARVQAPRSDRNCVFTLWSDDAHFDSLDAGFAMTMARLYRAQVRSQNRISLALVRANLVAMDDGQDRVWRLAAGYPGGLLHGEARVPSGVADRYWPHLETMLATWSWG